MRFVDEFADDAVEPEPPEPPVEHERPQWLGPPTGELGIAVPLGLVLARSDSGVVAVSHALVHSTGISFEVVAHVGGLKPGQVHTLFHEQHARAPGVDELPDGFLRFGVELADGRRASNLGWRRHLAVPDENPHGPVLFQHGGGGGQSSGSGASWSLAFWLWPLPPDGSLGFVCEWPVAQIELARAEIEAGPLLEAARRASPIWAADEGGGAWTSSVGQSVLQATAQPPEPPAAEARESISLPLAQVRKLEAALQATLAALRRAGA